MLPGDRMAGASGGMIFLNGIGAVSGPVITAWMMVVAGPAGFWLFIAMLAAALAGYAALRMRLRPGVMPAEETGRFAPLTQVSGVVAVELAQDYSAETAAAPETPGSVAPVRGAA